MVKVGLVNSQACSDMFLMFPLWSIGWQEQKPRTTSAGVQIRLLMLLEKTTCSIVWMCIGARRSIPGLLIGIPFIVKVRAMAQQAPVMSPGSPSARRQGQVVLDRSINGFINSLVMRVHGQERMRLQWLRNVSGGWENYPPFSAIIIMMTAFLRAFVSFRHVWTEAIQRRPGVTLVSAQLTSLWYDRGRRDEVSSGHRFDL